MQKTLIREKLLGVGRSVTLRTALQVKSKAASSTPAERLNVLLASSYDLKSLLGMDKLIELSHLPTGMAK